MKNKLAWVGVLVVVIVVAGLAIWYSSVNNSTRGQPLGNNSASTTAPTPTSSPTSYLFSVYSIANPDGLLLTDSSGRRTGEDPKTGAIYQEIPNTTYVPQPRSIQLTFTRPPAGQYTIQVIGHHAGQYNFETGIYNGAQSAPVLTHTGNIQPGQVITYTQNYDPSNWASSTLVQNN